MTIAAQIGAFLNLKPTKKHLAMLFGVALLIRALSFFFYIQHEERYNQGDTADYHHCAVSMANGRGMTMNGYPRFWRAPGYPFYIQIFYTLFNVKTNLFKQSRTAQMVAIWLQILICSLLPLVIFYLTLLLTSALPISWLAAWISVFHIGAVITSGFLMTDAFGALLFYLYLIFFFSSFALIGEPVFKKQWILPIIAAALTLSIFTYIRPMGNYVYFISMFLLLLFSKDLLTLRLKKFLLFSLIFFGITGPWYIRNYNLTGKLFFCPMFGLYFNTFVAPNIASKVYGGTLEENLKKQQYLGQVEATKVAQSLRGTGLLVVPEIEYGRAVWPLLLAHPFIALSHWMKHVFITLFDTFSNQHIVDFARGNYWEPLDPILIKKFKDSLYQEPMPLFMRLICWLEFLFTLFIWLGMFVGIVLFFFRPLFKWFKVSDYSKQMMALWFKVGIFIAAVVFMTGGYGYARLRLPVDLLIIILSLSFWYWFVNRDALRLRLPV